MKKSIDFLWVAFLLLALLTILLSQMDCIRYVPTSAVEEMGEITMPHPLPDPDYYNAFEFVLRLSLLSAALLLFWNTALNVLGNIIALVQVLVMLFLVKIVIVLDGIHNLIGCTMVKIEGYWEHFAIYYIITGLSIVMFAYSLYLTYIRISYKKKTTQPNKPVQIG